MLCVSTSTRLLLTSSVTLFIKICGLRTPEMVDVCVDLGVDAIGFVFAEASVRNIDPSAVRVLMQRVPPTVEGVGVFMNTPVDVAADTLAAAGLGTAQLHGAYSSADIHSLEARGVRVIRALSVSEYLSDGAPVDRVLIDGDNPGSGAEFAASRLAGVALPERWILAGGLTPLNVARRVQELAPTGVDVSSGVESSRGVKSAELITRFVTQARC